jgi:hypothetical protein
MPSKRHQFLLDAIPQAMKVDATTRPHDLAKAICRIGGHPRVSMPHCLTVMSWVGAYRTASFSSLDEDAPAELRSAQMAAAQPPRVDKQEPPITAVPGDRPPTRRKRKAMHALVLSDRQSSVSYLIFLVAHRLRACSVASCVFKPWVSDELKLLVQTLISPDDPFGNPDVQQHATLLYHEG